MARARASGQSLSRRLESKETRAPPARAASNAARTVSLAEAEIAMLMPEACTKRVSRSSASGTSAGVIRLAAEPARR